MLSEMVGRMKCQAQLVQWCLEKSRFVLVYLFYFT